MGNVDYAGTKGLMTLLLFDLDTPPRLRPPTGPFQLNRDTSRAQDVVAWWPFNNRFTNADIKDASDNQIDLSLVSGADIKNVVDTELGKAFDFPSGNATNVQFADFNAVAPTAEMTVASWMNARVGTLLWGSVVKHWTDGGGGTIHFGFDTVSGKISTFIGQSNGTLVGPVIDPNVLSLKTWHRIVSVADGSNLRLYIDGQEVGAALSYDGTLRTNGGNKQIAIGSKFGTTHRLDGTIGDTIILRRGWSPAEVRDDFAVQTRWDLYHEPGRMLYFFAASAPLAGDSRITQLGVEVAVRPKGRRISQIGVEVAFHEPGPRRISQLGAEVAVRPDERRISQIGVEVAIPTGDVGWVPFAFTPSMRVIGSALRGATDFVDASLDARGIPLGEPLADCPTGEVGKDKVVEDSIAPGAVSVAHAFNDAASIALNQNEGALKETHALSFTRQAVRDMEIFFTFVASTTNVQGAHMLVQAEIRENGTVLMAKSVVLTVAKAAIDHLGTVGFRARVPAGTTEYTVHMNINDNSTAPTVRNRTMFARDIKA